MKFRPCIDIHNGKVKQLVGGTLRDDEDRAEENFVSEKDAAYYASLYKSDGLIGGHIIILNPMSSPFYIEDREQARAALAAFPGGLQIGGGMNDTNAQEFICMGASHIIFTSFVFNDGEINYENLGKLVKKIGSGRIVLDLSCRKRGGEYYIVTDRWQKFTEVMISHDALDKLAGYCAEFLVHAVDVEGKAAGIEIELATLLGSWNGIPITYAGGVSSYADLELLRSKTSGRIDVTIGSSLDLFGGKLEYKKIVEMCR